MNPDQTIDDLLAKYLANETDTQETDIVGEWKGTSKENQRIFEHSKLIFEGVSSLKNQKTVDVDAAWKKLNISHNYDNESTENQTVKPIIKLNWLNNFLKIAAVLVILFGLWFVAAKQFVVPKNDVISFKTDKTPVEKILPDGTKILVKEHSSITYPTAFKGDTREINLVGEAFFEVHHDATHPFIIHTQGTTVRVLGTSFNVKAYNAQVQVVVKTGRVHFSKNNAEVILEKGQKGELLANVDTIIKSEVEERRTVVGDKKISLNFEEISLGEVAEKLSKTFGKKISFNNDNIKNCKLTASFQDEELENIINVIAETFNLKIENNVDGIVLSGEGCGTQ